MKITLIKLNLLKELLTLTSKLPNTSPEKETSTHSKPKEYTIKIISSETHIQNKILNDLTNVGLQQPLNCTLPLTTIHSD